MAAFPLPQRLLEVEALPGLTAEKVARLHGVATAPLQGDLDPGRLALDPEEAIARMRELRGIGPCYAALIVVRAAGLADVPAREPHALAAAANRYGLDGPPGEADWAAMNDRWRPFRTWATVLLRLAGNRAGVT